MLVFYIFCVGVRVERCALVAVRAILATLVSESPLDSPVFMKLNGYILFALRTLEKF